ncbi:MAG: hypothetical protein ABJA78_02235 [Ferruginibacter sp.]
MSKAKRKTELSREEILDEIKKLTERAKQHTSQQIDLDLGGDLGDEDIDFGFDSSKLKDTANPEESYRLYYGIRRLLMDNLPGGKSNKKLRQLIYDEKNLFLNRGFEIKEDGIRGQDGRMTYIGPFLIDAFNAVVEWIKTGANPYDVFQTFYDMNEIKGYHQPKENTTSEDQSSFDQKLKILLKTSPPKKDK